MCDQLPVDSLFENTLNAHRHGLFNILSVSCLLSSSVWLYSYLGKTIGEQFEETVIFSASSITAAW